MTNCPNSWLSRPPSTSTISSVSLKGEDSRENDPPGMMRVVRVMGVMRMIREVRIMREVRMMRRMRKT